MSALPAGWDAALGPLAPPALRHPLDASCWRLTTAGGVRVLFDAGAGLGPAPPVPDLLVLTHAHADHAGGAARLAAGGARVAAGERTAAWLAASDEAAVSLDRAWAAGVYPADYRLPPCAGIEAVGDGARLAVGDVALVAVATPGHSADHVAWLVERNGLRVLVGGDALFAEGTVILQDTWDCSVADSCATVRRLHALAPDAILPGHGPPLLGRDARDALGAAMGRVARLLPPRLFM